MLGFTGLLIVYLYPNIGWGHTWAFFTMVNKSLPW